MATAASLTAAVDAAAAAADAAGAGGDPAAAVARLQELGQMKITTALLMATSAGKRVRKLAKADNKAVADAAAAVVAAWKAAVSAAAPDAAPAKRPASPDAAADASAKKAKPAAAADVKPEKKEEDGGDKAGTTATPAGPVPPSGDPARDKAVASLAAALALVPDADRDGADPAAVAAAVERAALAAAGGGATAAYKAKLRSLLFNLRAPDNPDLRRDVMAGAWDPAELVVAPPEALASRARRAENAAIREAALFEAERGQNLKKATTDQFQCGKCRQRKCTYFQMQTRSADEPMTTFVTCVNCGNRWKFC